mgnify:CR=1 FL=1
MAPRARRIGSLAALPLALLALAMALELDERPLAFASRESKTRAGATVYNEVRRRRSGGRELWVMRQSHDGPTLDRARQDLLLIEVDPDRGTADFAQLRPSEGDPVPGETREAAPFRASCFRCHPSGLRALRPDFDDPRVQVSTWDRLRLAAWNLRIKAYGRLRAEAAAGSNGVFRSERRFDRETLKAETCLRCHSEGGPRAPLERQHTETIRHLVSEGEMPPFPFALSDEENVKIQDFVDGF